MKLISIEKRKHTSISGSRSKDRLELSADLLGDEMIRGLIDQWIVPRLVEEFFAQRGATASEPPQDDNGEL
jgi:hypothetical protein